MSKTYIKDSSRDPIYNPINPYFTFRSRIVPGVIFSLAILILITQVVIPMYFFKTQDEISKPMSSSILGIATGFSDFSYSELSGQNNNVTDLENLPKFFYISIPKLDIVNAKVEINSPSLSPDTSLGHYAGSGLPGQVGNAFIYGHSVLPWFYNPKNYKTIFSTLHILEIGDSFSINFGNSAYTYKVESKETLYPDKVNPLAEFKPKYLNESTVTLMTCSPPGTRIKRLLVRAVVSD